MSEKDVITSGRQLPSGAHFFKCALQVNPHHYAGTFRGQESTGNPTDYAAAIVEKAAELDVSVLTITDHNNVSNVPVFRRAAESRGITILPGFELASSEGIHVLCIYPPDSMEEKLERFLGEFGIRSTEPSSDLSTESFEDVLGKIREQGGIAIAAHATSNKGFFKLLDGQARIRAWQNEHLLAIQIPGPIGDLAQDVRQIAENKNPEYLLEHPSGERQAVAMVNAGDVTKPEDLENLSATCWIKMSEITIEGLRQAFLDPDSRIRLNSDPLPEEHTELLTLEWEGGFLGGTTINFNPNLNVLVGGRGAGKSTIVESLRYVLALDPIGEEARKGHDGMVRQVLRSGTKVSLHVLSYRPTKRKYLIERIIPNPPVVRDEMGQISNLTPMDILPRVEVYGQHEISEITRSGENLTRLLDRFVKHDDSLRQRKASVRRNLEQARRSLLDVQTERQQIDEQLAALPSLEETLVRFQEAGLEDRLREQSLLVREESVLDSIPERVQAFRECLETLRQELPIDRAFLSPSSLEELPGKEILAAANQVLERLSDDLGQVAKALEEAIRRSDEGVEGIRSRWNERKREVDAVYQKILRDLQASAVDGEQFIRLRREIEGLRPLRERRPLLERLEKEYTDKRTALLAEWEDVKAEEFRLLDRAAKTVSRDLRSRVQVAVTAARRQGAALRDTQTADRWPSLRGNHQHQSVTGPLIAGVRQVLQGRHRGGPEYLRGSSGSG